MRFATASVGDLTRIELEDGRWAVFEVTLGTGLVDQGAASLRKFNSLIDTDTCGAPTVLGVISGNGYGYVRPDGVAVIPVGALAA